MKILTKQQITKEVGKKWFLADEHSLTAKFIYLSGINGFDNVLANQFQDEISAVIHLIEFPNGIIIKLAKLFSSQSTALKFNDIKSIISIPFDYYSIFKIKHSNGEIHFVYFNENKKEIESFFKKSGIDIIIGSNNEINPAIKDRLTEYLYEFTDYISYNTDNVLATKNKRFLGWFVDMIIISLISIFIHIISSTQKTDMQYSFIPLIVLIFYYIIFESFGFTFGKVITNTKVVKTNGIKSDSRDIFIRTLCRLIPFEAFSFLGSRTGWHDKFSKTVVVDNNLKSKIYLNNVGNQKK